MKQLRTFFSFFVIIAIFTLSFSSASYAVDGKKYAVLSVPQIQSTVSPLATNIDYYIRKNHHGKKKYCRDRHCNHWHNGHNKYGEHIRYCKKWHYSGCYWVNPHDD